MSTRKIGLLIGLSVFFVIAVIFVFSLFTIIPTGHTGVVLKMGAVDETVLSEGFHFKAPFVEKIVVMNNQTVKTEAESSAASRDMQTITSTIAVNYHVDKASSPYIYSNIGLNYDSVVVAPAIQESFKAVTSRYTAEELITKRQTISQEIKEVLHEKLNPYGIVVDMFNIVNLDFSAEFNAAIEAKQTAQQEALKAEQDLIRIQVEAQQKIAQAQAEAESIRLIQETLKTSPEYIEYIKWSKWNGELPTVMGNSDLLLDINSLIE